MYHKYIVLPSEHPTQNENRYVSQWYSLICAMVGAKYYQGPRAKLSKTIYPNCYSDFVSYLNEDGCRGLLEQTADMLFFKALDYDPKKI